MSRDRLSFISGFMPALCMAMLLGFEYIIDSGAATAGRYVVAAAEIVPFFLPYLIIVLLKRLLAESPASNIAGFTRKAVPFVIFASCGTAIMSFLVNCIVSMLSGNTPYQQVRYSDTLEGAALTIVIIAVLPSIFEELLFREGVMGAFEAHGTVAAIFVSSLTFAMLHGSLQNLWGPMLAGMVYGYMVYTLGSIWPGIIAHMAHNCFYLLMGYATRAYETLGIWPYFIVICTVVFAVFLYLAMRSLGKLIEKGKIRRLRPGGLKGFVGGVFFSPGVWLMVLMFAIRLFYIG